LAQDIELKCFGHIRNVDTSPMGLYGIVCEEGVTEMRNIVGNVQRFDTKERDWVILDY